MAKTYTWRIPETVTDEETEQEKEVTHEVMLVCSMLTGKAKITIDSTEFDISTRFLGLRGTNQVFRLGEMAAIVDFPKKGEPDLVIDGKCVRSGKAYAG